MKRKISLLVVLTFLVSSIFTVHADELNLDAPSYLLMDMKSGRILLEKDSNQVMYPASVTKMMTAILALENGKLDQIMTASLKASNPGNGGANADIRPDEQVTMDDLLHALLIKSANEAANVIAENIGGTQEKFVELMNSKASELGATQTHFVTVSGMHDDNHYSTVADMAKIAFYAMKKPEFRNIVHKSKYDMLPTNKHSTSRTIYSTNRLFGYKSDYYTEVTGIKTGYTSQAGNNLVASAVNESGMELCTVMFGVRNTGTSNKVYTLSKELLEYGFKNFSIRQLTDKNVVIKSINVENAKEDDALLNLVTADSLSCVMSNTSNFETKETYFQDSIKAPVKKGTPVGYVEYKSNGVSLGKVDIIASKDVEMSMKAKSIDRLKRAFKGSFIKKLFVAFLFTILGFLLLRITLRKISRSLKQKKMDNP